VDANSAPLPGITVRLGLALIATTVTRSDGSYAFTTLHRGAYSVEPVASGCTLTPSAATFPGLTSSTTANFGASGPNCGGAISNTGATQGPFTLSGRVVDLAGNSVPGAKIILSGAAEAVRTTDGTGSYNFPVSAGVYSIAAAGPCAFTPNVITLNVLGARQLDTFVRAACSKDEGGTADGVAADAGKIDANELDSSPAKGCDVDTIACLRTRDKAGDPANVRCSQCAIDNGCFDPTLQGGKCEDTMGLAPGSCAAVVGTTSAPTETQVCLKTLNDIFSSQCAGALGLTPCLCGSTDPEQCLAGAVTPNGPLLPEYTCDFGTTSAVTMQAEFVLQTFGAGQANALVQCLASFGCNCF
jgi:hypothetical protein